MKKLNSIRKFCADNDLAVSFLYKLWAQGKGPRRVKVGARTFITDEAAEDWHRQLEAEAAGAQAA